MPCSSQSVHLKEPKKQTFRTEPLIEVLRIQELSHKSIQFLSIIIRVIIVALSIRFPVLQLSVFGHTQRWGYLVVFDQIRDIFYVTIPFEP